MSVMMNLILAVGLLPVVFAPQAQTVSAVQVRSDLRVSLAGDWVGVLEYRDYQEPAGSSKRVDLPTWLRVTDAGIGRQSWHYVYDDGPGKTVDEMDVVTFDPSKASYASVDNDKPARTFAVQGYGELKAGRGVLVLVGDGTENEKLVEIRETITIRWNLLELLQETRPARSQEVFVFRHLYRFVRAQVPAVTGK